MTYDEAIQTAKQRLRIWDGYGGNDTPESVIDQANGVADALRALLAGPPEPMALSASDASCYAFPGEDQGPLRDAFVQGALSVRAGPPEPSEEEVAALVAEHVRKDFGVLKVGMKTLVQGIQALYRSRRA